jgi:hypothetical protein
MKNITCWAFLSKYINSFKDGSIISRKDIIDSFHNESFIYTFTVDGYIRLFKKIRVLETLSRGKYKKIQDIPHGLSSTRARHLACDISWKTWFIDLKDRI